MRIMQLDVNSIIFEPVKPEIQVHELADKKKVSIKDALVLFISVEKEDNEALGSKAVKDAVDFAEKNKISNLVLYPWAHLSSDLEEPQRSQNLFQYMVKEAEKSKLKIIRAPFGWTKALSLDIKGHPLAELSRNYNAKGKVEKVQKGARKIDTSIVRKSDFAGLPESDHRTIGEKQDLFSFQEVSPGMVYWHPKGLILYHNLVEFSREKQREYDYQEISTPSMANLALWHVSGHIDHYKENMFMTNSNNEDLGLKPMNCPSTILIYKARKWSYRELPFRTSMFDRLYRNEISGALTGLFRVRELTQDDSHIFVREDQAPEELQNVLKLLDELYSTFGFTYKAKLSTMPDSHAGDEKTWAKATMLLEDALKKAKIKYEVKEKEGAFYGPKIDVDIKDSMGREWQCATIQADYQMPLKFNLEYIGEDGAGHTPILIHRALLGSLERFIGVLIEHYQGRFPTWLAPVQVRVITISEHANKYAESVYKELRKNGIRCEIDVSDKTLQYKIRDGQLQQIPYMIILGEKESTAKKISVRSRSGKQKMGESIESFIESIKKEIANRKNELML